MIVKREALRSNVVWEWNTGFGRKKIINQSHQTNNTRSCSSSKIDRLRRFPHRGGCSSRAEIAQNRGAGSH